MRIDRLVDAHDLELRWVHFPLHPEIPPEGMALSELFAGRVDMLEEMMTRLQALMAEEGLPYGDRKMTYNSRLAQELGAWADGRDGGDAIHDALFRAYFVDGKNLAELDVLVDVAESVGLDGDAARSILESRAFREAVDRDWARSRALGVTGVPTFVIDGKGVVGAQPYEVLEQLVQAAT